MMTVWLFLFLVPAFRGLCELGADFGNPVIWPLMAILLLAPSLASSRTPRAGSSAFRRGAGLLGFVAAVVLLRRANVQVLETRHWVDALLLACVGLGSFGASRFAGGERGARPGTWVWITGWTLTGLVNPWLPMLGGALGTSLDAWGLLPEVGLGETQETGPRVFLAALLLGVALPKPYWDFGFLPQADLAMAAFGGAVLVVVLLPNRMRKLPYWVCLGALALGTTFYFQACPAASSAFLGLAAGCLLPRLVARPAELLGGVLLGLMLSFILHSNLQVAAIRAWAWWGA